jgi:hypothetical protein
LPVDIDRILDAQRRVAEAEIRYHQSRAEYAIAQKNVQLERGALVSENDFWVIDGVANATSDAVDESVPALVKPPAPAGPVPANPANKPLPLDGAAKLTSPLDGSAIMKATRDAMPKVESSDLLPSGFEVESNAPAAIDD